MMSSDFKFSNKYLSYFGMMICEFDGGADSITIGSQISFNTTKSANSDKLLTLNTEYSEPLSTSFQIAKIDDTNSVIPLTMEEIRAITLWLQTADVRELRFCDNKYGFDEIIYTGSFDRVSRINKNGMIVGLEVSFLSNLPYGLTEEQVIEIDALKNSDFSLINDNDMNGYFVPRLVEITLKEAGDFVLYNKNTKIETVITGCIANEVISIDQELQWLSTNYQQHDIHDCFNYNFIKIFRRDESNENSFFTSLNCTLKVYCSYARKVGI